MDVERGDNDEFIYTYSMKVGICYLEGGVEILKEMDYPDEIIQSIREYDQKEDVKKGDSGHPETQ
jgi:DNA mismatch repair ATPase MutS